jgi:hypothetical protein
MSTKHGATYVSVTGDNSHTMPDLKLWVCDSSGECPGQVRARINPLECPEGCGRELLLAPMSRQVAS